MGKKGEWKEKRESEKWDRKIDKGKEREVLERSYIYINLDKIGFIDYIGNIICLFGCNFESVF